MILSFSLDVHSLIAINNFKRMKESRVPTVVASITPKYLLVPLKVRAGAFPSLVKGEPCPAPVELLPGLGSVQKSGFRFSLMLLCALMVWKRCELMREMCGVVWC